MPVYVLMVLHQVDIAPCMIQMLGDLNCSMTSTGALLARLCDFATLYHVRHHGIWILSQKS